MTSMGVTTATASVIPAARPARFARSVNACSRFLNDM